MDKTTLKKILNIATFAVLCVGVLFCIVLLCVFLFGKNNKNNTENEQESVETSEIAVTTVAEESATPEPTIEPTPEPITYTEYTLCAAGDAMLYASQVECARTLGKTNGTTFDFSDLTKYVKNIVSSADLAVFNLEGTMLGDGNYRYYPTFNVPDEFAKTLKETGFDIALFANNHTYDTEHDGFIRTQNVLKDAGFPVLGTRTTENSEESKGYGIYKCGDISLGMLDYTYEAPPESEATNSATKFLNGIKVYDSDINLIDSFNYNLLDSFFEEVGGRITELKADGAEFIVFFIHWGDEYEEYESSEQKYIAQKLCDLGVDLLIGSHPHVVEPVATYKSSDGQRKMLCYYSTGNFTSAQNRATYQSKPDYAWLTENEIFAMVTLRKYSTGEVVISKADYEPLWQHRHSADGRLQLPIVPLRYALASDEAKEEYGLNESSFGVTHATAAYEYITNLVGPGIDAFNSEITLPYTDAEATEKKE